MLVEPRPARRAVVVDPQGEPVAAEPGDHVKVDVEDLLPGRLAVGQEEIDAFGAEGACLDGVGHPQGDFHHPAARRQREIAERRGMPFRSDE